MAISLSHGGGETIYSAGSPSTQVLVGTLDGVVTIERDGSGWRVTNRSLKGKHIHALLFEDGSGQWFAGVTKGGNFRQHRRWQELGAARQRTDREGCL